MKKLDDQTIINGILNNDSKVINYLYKKHYPPIQKLVLKNKGCEDDAMNIFQASVVTLLDKIRDNDLDLFASLLTYQYAICRNSWLNELKRKKKFHGFFIDIDLQNELPDKEDEYEKFRLEIKHQLYEKHFKTLSKLCRDILTLYLRNISTREIAAKLMYDQEVAVRRQKYECKKALIKRIRKDPKFQEMESYEND